MKIFAMDIGAGTLDVLLYDSNKKLENSVKMVLPSPAKVYAKRVLEKTLGKKDIFIKGDTIGGGALSKALQEHIAKGLNVDNLIPFHIWKESIKAMGFIKQKDWYYSNYGIYCNNIRTGKWNPCHLVREHYKKDNDG